MTFVDIEIVGRPGGFALNVSTGECCLLKLAANKRRDKEVGRRVFEVDEKDFSISHYMADVQSTRRTKDLLEGPAFRERR